MITAPSDHMTFHELELLNYKKLPECDLNRHLRSILSEDLGIPFSAEVPGKMIHTQSRKPKPKGKKRIDFVIYPTEWMYSAGITRPLFVELKRYESVWGKALAQADDYRMSGFEIKQVGENAITQFAYDHCLMGIERADGLMYPENVFVAPDLSVLQQVSARHPEYWQFFNHEVSERLRIGSMEIDLPGKRLRFAMGMFPFADIQTGMKCKVYRYAAEKGFKNATDA